MFVNCLTEDKYFSESRSFGILPVLSFNFEIFIEKENSVFLCNISYLQELSVSYRVTLVRGLRAKTTLLAHSSLEGKRATPYYSGVPFLLLLHLFTFQINAKQVGFRS